MWLEHAWTPRLVGLESNGNLAALCVRKADNIHLKQSEDEQLMILGTNISGQEIICSLLELFCEWSVFRSRV